MEGPRRRNDAKGGARGFTETTAAWGAGTVLAQYGIVLRLQSDVRNHLVIVDSGLLGAVTDRKYAGWPDEDHLKRVRTAKARFFTGSWTIGARRSI